MVECVEMRAPAPELAPGSQSRLQHSQQRDVGQVTTLCASVKARGGACLLGCAYELCLAVRGSVLYTYQLLV